MTFIDRTGEASRDLRAAYAPVAEDMARVTAGEIVGLMRSSDPSGEEYADPEAGLYEASAPGEPPAIRTGEYARSFGHTEAELDGERAVARVTNDRMVGREGRTPLWILLEYGTFAVAPRPHVRPGAVRAAKGIGREARKASAR